MPLLVRYYINNTWTCNWARIVLAVTIFSLPIHHEGSNLFYSVSRGKSENSVGIYTDWQSCQREVTFVSGAKFNGSSTLDEAIQVLKTNGIAAVVIHHLGETYNPSSFRQKFTKYGVAAPSSSRAEYVQDDIADIAINETPRRALKSHPDLDVLIALSSEDHIKAACHITELEVGDDQTEVYLNLLCYFMLAIQSFYQNLKMN